MPEFMCVRERERERQTEREKERERERERVKEGGVRYKTEIRVNQNLGSQIKLYLKNNFAITHTKTPTS